MANEKYLNEDNVRIIKISKEAIFEFIYEKFIDGQEIYFDVNPLDVISACEMNFERGEFICCISRAEDVNGNLLKFPEEIDLQNLMKNIPDTTSTMFDGNRYKEYTKEELAELSKKGVINFDLCGECPLSDCKRRKSMKTLKIMTIIGWLALFFASLFNLINAFAEKRIFGPAITLPLFGIALVGIICDFRQSVDRPIFNNDIDGV